MQATRLGGRCFHPPLTHRACLLSVAMLVPVVLLFYFTQCRHSCPKGKVLGFGSFFWSEGVMFQGMVALIKPEHCSRSERVRVHLFRGCSRIRLRVFRIPFLRAG